MPKIIINEVDLTNASNQPAVTDVAYVPGFSCINDAPTDLTYCDSITNSEGTGFEDIFGTRPDIIGAPVASFSTNDTTLDGKIIATVTDSEKYEKYFPYSAIFVYDSDQKDWRVGKKLLGTVSDDASLATIGIELKFKNNEDETALNPEGKPIESLFSDSASNGEKNNYSISVSVQYDLSYVYAKELIKMGIPVVYQVVSSIEDLPDVYDESNTEGLVDKGEYSIKYLTSGAYPSFKYVYSNKKYYFSAYQDAGQKISIPDPVNFASNMLAIAKSRGDCVALIDAPLYAQASTATENVLTNEVEAILTSGYGQIIYTDGDETTSTEDKSAFMLPLIGEGSLWSAVNVYCDSAENLEYGAMFYPWATYDTQAGYYYELDGERQRIAELSSVGLPASFGYLMSLGKSIKTNNNWLAIAGIARGQVPYIRDLKTSTRLSNTIADAYQPRNGNTSIIAITNIKPYGFTIWGNRTMKNNKDTANGGLDGLTATSFLNVRNMVSDVKKTVYNAAKNLMFEQNSDVLWVNFLSQITPLLDKLMSGQGLSNYKIVKKATKAKAKLEAVIKLYPIYAVEEFEVTIELSDEDVSVV